MPVEPAVPLPASARRRLDDASRLVVGRALRGGADGLVSVLLASYLTALGLSPLRIGAIVTGTLVGSAALTLATGLTAHRYPLRTLLLAACAVMAATGVAFALVTSFWLLLAVAVVGTLNPSPADVSVFLPTEQALLANLVADHDRARRFAVYNLAGALAGAGGALASGLPDALARALGVSSRTTTRAAFVLYGAVAVGVLALYRGLHPEAPGGGSTGAGGGSGGAAAGGTARAPLRTSRPIVLRLAALFALDSAAGGFTVTSLLVLWLHLRFDLSSGTTATVFFVAGLLGGGSQLLSHRLARRIGLVRTMAYTHLPANALLIGAAFAPDGRLAVALLLGRALFASMDVPARQAFVMSVVPPEERAAASSITNVPRSLASATTPLLAGWLLDRSTFGWPLLIAGTGKVVYDLLLLALYRTTPERPASPP